MICLDYGIKIQPMEAFLIFSNNLKFHLDYYGGDDDYRLRDGKEEQIFERMQT